MSLVRILLGAVVAVCGGYYVWHLPVPREWRARRRAVRAARDQVRFLHSGHIDALPRSGGPKGGERDGH